MLKITINNSYEVPDNEHSDLADATITLRNENENGLSPEANFGSDITFYGAAYNIIIDALINDPNGSDNFVLVTIYDDCCNETIFKGKVTRKTIDFCEVGEDSGCAVKCTLEEFDEESLAYVCLQNKIVSENFDNGLNGPFEQRTHPFVRYCYAVRPVFLHHIIINLAVGIIIIMYALVPSIAIISLIVSAVNALCDLFGDPCIDFDENEPGTQSLIGEYLQIIELVKQWVAGCGEGNISPLVRDYIRNACDQCGLTFESSVLTDPSSLWYNTVYFAMPSKTGQNEYQYSDGSLNPDTIREYFDYNSPIETGYKYIGDIAGFFNCKWWIDGNVVKMEPKSTIIVPLWIDFTLQENYDKILSLCYEFSGDKQPAGASFQYSKDGIEVIGNEALLHFNDIVDYQITGPNPNLVGLKKYTLQYGASRYRQDGISTDILEFYEKILQPFIGTYPNFLLIHNGTCLFPKLLVWDPDSGYNEAKIKRLQYDFGATPRWFYNYHMWFNEGNHPVGSSKKTNLYSGYIFGENMYKFYDSEDPRKDLKQGLNFKLEFLYQCDDLTNLLALGTNYQIMLPFFGEPKLAVVKSVTIKTQIITMEGEI